MAEFGVVKEFYEKYPMPGMTSPLVNKYSEHCKKQHMPTKVKVIPKKNLVKAIEFALQKDGDVSKNAQILNLNEEIEVSKLNEKNFCCISHRWCTTEISVDKFCEIFSQFLKNGYLCAEDTCFEEKKFYEHASSWWAFMGKLVELVFPKMVGAQEFMAYLGAKTSLIGFKDFKDKLQVEPNDIDDMSEVRSYSYAHMQPNLFTQLIHAISRHSTPSLPTLLHTPLLGKIIFLKVSFSFF